MVEGREEGGKKSMPFEKKSERSKNSEGKEISVEAENQLVDPNIKSHFCEDMVATIE